MIFQFCDKKPNIFFLINQIKKKQFNLMRNFRIPVFPNNNNNYNYTSQQPQRLRTTTTNLTNKIQMNLKNDNETITKLG